MKRGVMNRKLLGPVGRVECIGMCLALLLSFGIFSASSVFAGPTEELRPTMDAVVAVLVDPDLRGEERRSQRRTVLMELAASRFDFEEMSKRVLGKVWRQISDEEKDHFVGIFTQLLENAYLGKIENYSGEEIRFVDERVKENRAVVSTLFEHQGQDIPIHYVMLLKEGRWLVYDINIEGVSFVNNYRQQFTSILRREKFAGLVSQIEKKNRLNAVGGEVQ